MLFLLNDVVLEVRPGGQPIEAGRFRTLSLGFVLELGQELFAEQPRLQHTDPTRAGRLASLITAKAPQVNAALFVAPEAACKPEAVQSRVCEIGIEVMADLYGQQQRGALNAVAADREVWRRLAA